MFNLKVLSKEETEKILKMNDVIKVVESAYAQKAAKNARIFDWVFNAFEPGVSDMDIKSGWLKVDGVYGMKLVSWFSENPNKNLPAVIGVILVFDDETGVPIGLVDGSHITGMRTGAAGAIGAKYCARKDSNTLLMVGTGHIAKFEVAATLLAVPSIEKVYINDPIKLENAKKMQENLRQILKEEFDIDRDIQILVASNLEKAVRDSDIIITATPSTKPMIEKEWIKDGTHLSCIGSDMPGKEEIDPNIFEDARVFVDDLEQCINIGEIEIPVKMNILKPEDVAGEIGDVINGTVKGRRDDKEITIFDATGTALLDIITAQLAFRKAEKMSIGTSVNL